MIDKYRQKEVGIEELFLSPLRVNRVTPKVSQSLIAITREYGPQVPVVVREAGERRYEILANAETWIAVQRIGLYQVPITIREDVDDEEARFLVNDEIEDDLISEATKYQDFLDELIAEGGKRSVARVAREFGKSRSYVSHALRLLTLPYPVKEALINKLITLGHAKALLSASTVQKQGSLLEEIIRKKLSVRQTEQMVRTGEVAKNNASDRATEAEKDPDIVRLENKLGEILGSRVTVQHHRGVLEIDYGGNNDVFDGILGKLGYSP